MEEQLQARLVAMLRRPRAIKPQTERQLATQLAEHSLPLPQFLFRAATLLEDHELDIVFGPLFTPTLAERAELADLLFHWRPTGEQLQRLIGAVGTELATIPIALSDGSIADLTLHEVMVERFVRLLRLEHGPEAAVAAALRESLPVTLWPMGMALMCERGMTATHQRWLAAFMHHASSRRPVTADLLRTTAEFIAGQPKLDRASVLAAAEALLRATQGTATIAASGHTYWSADVAQHHHYRGQGRVDQERLEREKMELACITAIVDDLRTFDADDSNDINAGDGV